MAFVRTSTFILAVALFLGSMTTPVSAASLDPLTSVSSISSITDRATLEQLLARTSRILAELIAQQQAQGEVDTAAPTAALAGSEVTEAATAPSYKYREEPTNNWQNRVGNADGLKVLWWNAQCEEKKAAANQNIQALVSDEKARPDVLIIGEYCHNAYYKVTLKELEENGYVHSEWIEKYSPYHVGKSGVTGDENGMRVFSRYPLEDVKVKKVSNLAGFMDQGYVKSCIAGKYKGKKESHADYWSRSYLEFDVTKNKKDYQIAAIHFANPWVFMLDCTKNVLKVGNEIAFGTKNPTFGQAQTIANRYAGEKRTLVIGDTNAPRGFTLKLPVVGNTKVHSKAYKKLMAKLGGSDIKTTKPTGYTPVGNMVIDHAFASKDLDVNFASMIPLAGSDHTAIYTVVK